jgi:RNA polymerase sigma factor (TIGR02999 family)
MSEITLLLEAVERGKSRSSEELLPLVYDELRHLAAARLGRNCTSPTLQATALVHEAWLRLINQKQSGWNNREHFFRAAAQAMRHILVDMSRQKASLKRGSRPERLNIEDADLAATAPDDRILLVNEALTRLEAEDPDSARLITLKFFGGFTNQEIARMLGLGERTLERQWAYAKGSLYQLIQDDRDENPPSP